MTAPRTVEPGWTPGPWAANCSHIYAPDGAIIATVHNPGSKASDYPLVANRDLMAAAPALCGALEKAQATLWQYIGDLRFPPVRDSIERRLEAATKASNAVDAALLLARGEMVK